MTEKRTFQILDEMNQDDETNKTQTVIVGTSLISADKIQGGCKISMGMPEEVLYGIMSEDKMAILLIVDKNEYFRRTKDEKSKV